jgi:hypothetical protein
MGQCIAIRFVYRIDTKFSMPFCEEDILKTGRKFNVEKKLYHKELGPNNLRSAIKVL